METLWLPELNKKTENDRCSHHTKHLDHLQPVTGNQGVLFYSLSRHKSRGTQLHPTNSQPVLVSHSLGSKDF